MSLTQRPSSLSRGMPGLSADISEKSSYLLRLCFDRACSMCSAGGTNLRSPYTTTNVCALSEHRKYHRGRLVH